MYQPMSILYSCEEADVNFKNKSLLIVVLFCGNDVLNKTP